TQKVTTANITLNLGFPGQYYDAERQTWNNGYHDYSSVLGRYIESDPSGLAGGINTYAYVGDNPLTGVDPFGLLTEQQIAAIVFNETRSLSGSNILQARIDVASAVINGSNAYGDNGRPKTASDVANVPSAEESAYQNSLEATKTALCENKNGQDPTDGATHFNLRPNDSTGPFFGSPLSTQSGPFNNSFPTSDLPATGIYVNTYR
ncbi:RHS repeat-associated protein, partial [Rhodanobacter sp. K2T2]|uniref:RHS repeat-associated core domain-containing protein n=1 Tax=Rhodanobacter sp. K2T2 TaxID=2723085 RepID=UPI0015C8373C